MVYDRQRSYTIQDFLDLKLDDFVELINSTYKKANSELINVQQFNHIRDLWYNKVKFKLAKYFSGKTQEASMEESYHTITNFNFILIDINEIRYLVEDCTIKLMAIMNTPISDKIKQQSEELIFKLSQVLKISQLWMNAQYKVIKKI